MVCSRRSMQRLVPGSSHSIQVDKPEVVVLAIRDSISKAQRPR